MSNDSESGCVPIRKLPETDRTREIQDVFGAKYKCKPDFYVRVPGRVNLIGEHIDYCGFSVCPMALEQDILMAVAVETDSQKIDLHNLDPKFIDFQCDVKNFEINIGEGAPQWYQYFLCGLKGVLDTLPKNQKAKGMKIVISGNIPKSAGLSSSSALVSAAALVASYANKIRLNKETIANLCAECERYIGTQGGGMDQAIAFLATEGCAKHIEFSPLRATDLPLPKGSAFVIAHSLAKLNKAATSDFNCRVVECRLASQLIAKKKGLQWQNIRRLGDLQKSLSLSLEEMISIAESALHEEPYTKAEVVRELATTSDSLEETSLTPNTKHIAKFKLRQRALHVFNEALRVQKFNEACSNSQGEESSATLGSLMTQSHESLRDLYECSHPQLDRLVDLSKGLTLGTRLTGAGWGGCAVSILEPINVDKYVKFLKENFYKPLGVTESFDSVVFSTAPKAGACVYLDK